MSTPNIKGITYAEYRMARLLAAGEACYAPVKPAPGKFTATQFVAAVDAKRAEQRARSPRPLKQQEA